MIFRIDDAVPVLARTPRVVSAMLEGTPTMWLHQNEGGDSWTPFEVLGHLIHGERTDWIPRARIILEKGEGEAFKPFDRSAHLTEFRGREVSELCRLFADLRLQNLKTLDELHLTEPDLGRRGVHPALGPVTMRDLLATWVTHDLGHIAQIARVMAKQYRAEVGPWLEYIPILSR